MKKNKKAFSLIEVLIWTIIFLIWMAWVYATINSILKTNANNKNYIIATNLAKEQLELFRNIRDTNFSKNKAYNVINPQTWCSEDENLGCKKFEVWKFYKISNDFSGSRTFSVKVEEAKNSPSRENNSSLEEFRVCLDTKEWIYDYCSNISGEKKQLNLYKFLEISEVDYKLPKKWTMEKVDENQALLVKSKVIFSLADKNIFDSEFEVSEVFTNYKNY